MAKKRTTDAVELLHRRYIKGNATREAALRWERLNADIAVECYALRVVAGFTQARLAELIGTTQSVISRLEDADYAGRALLTLHRIAEACGCQVELKLSQLPRN